jgi:glycerol-3-phosphate acyltransferase PlsY
MLGTGIDITKVGSRNPGFNNVLRVASKWRAAIALIGDISKGYLALLLLSGGGTSASAIWGIGIAAVVGHCWSPFLKFNGGKGVATTVGVLLFLEPKITLICLPLYIILRFLGRRAHWKQEGAMASLSTMFVIVLVRHAPNLREAIHSKPE